MTYEKLTTGTPFKFKQVKGTFKVIHENNEFQIFKQAKKNFVYTEKIKEIGKHGIELHSLSPIFETTFLHIQFIREA